MIEKDPVQNELACLELFRNKVESFSETDRSEWIPQILRAVHLPVVGQKYNLLDHRNYGKPKKPYFCHPVLDFIVGHSQNIPRLGDLLWEAVNDNTCEWHLERFCNSALLQLCKWSLRCSFDYKETGALPNSFCIQHSKEVLIKGFRIVIHATPPSFGDHGKQYDVESRDEVRHRRQPSKHIVEIQQRSGGWTPVKTYQDGVVDEHAVDDMHEHIMDDDETFQVRVRQE